MVKLPFRGVDGLMDALDEPARPQTIELEVALSARLDDQRFREAVVAGASRHPMARARKVASRPLDANFAWQIEPAIDDSVVAVSSALDADGIEQARNAFSSRHIDIAAGPPFRLLLLHESDGDRVLLSVNHAAFDGLGALRLLQSVSRAYAGLDDLVPPVDPLTTRGVLDVAEGQRRESTTAPSLPKRSSRLAVPRSTSARGFGILHLDLAVGDLIAGSDATVNDVLLAAVHLAVDAWNRARSTGCADIGVMVPVSQRPASWRNEVVANLVLTGHVFSTAQQRVRPAELLQAISAQTKRMKTDGVPGSDQLARGGRTPVVLRQLLPKVLDLGAEHFADTTVLSNLGRIDDPPWFASPGRGIWFGPPPRRPVFLTIGAATVDEHLGLSLRWCASSMSRTDARAFADLLLAALEEVVRVSRA